MSPHSRIFHAYYLMNERLNAFGSTIAGTAVNRELSCMLGFYHDRASGGLDETECRLTARYGPATA
jgi:hypothetical protein